MAYDPTAENAFPYTQSIGEDACGKHDHFGLTKREYAAIHIAAALAIKASGSSLIAKTTVEIVNALFLELERTVK